MKAEMSFTYWEAPIIRRKKTPTEIIDIVAEEMNILPMIICSKSRKREIVDARRIIANYLCKQGQTLTSIGRLLGGRDHSTIIALRESYKDIYPTDRVFKRIADKINQVLN